MAWIFGDGFDLYALPADAAVGYWEVAGFGFLQPGRFPGSQALRNPNTSSIIMLAKTSTANDAVHHFVVSFMQTSAFSGTSVVMYFQLLDGVTGQCCIVFRSDGAILLTSGTPTGTTLATYTGGVPANNTWYGFEFEIVIHPTAGSFTVRRNGNPVNDFTATGLNTRPGTNTYANKLQIGNNTASSTTTQTIDDMLWRSDVSSLPWVGDIRCYTRMPGSDVSVQFAKSPDPYTYSYPLGGSVNDTTSVSRYSLFTPAYNGVLNSISVSFVTGFTGNCKLALFAASAGNPGPVIASANSVVNPVAGYNSFTFSTPPTMVKGTTYWFGVSHDVSANINSVTSNAGRSSSTVNYASFPISTPVVISSQVPVSSIMYMTTGNNDMVNETIQDGTNTYVYDSTVGNADFYNLQALAGTPATVVAVTTRGFIAKSDAGFRSGAVQLKSGAVTVASPTVNLSTNFGWAWRIDTVDPNTGTTWVPVAVNSVQIGPIVIG